MSFLVTYSDEASKTYKDAVRTATNGPINLAAAPAIISAVTLNLEDRVLVKDQGDATTNGIYVFKGAGNPLVRATDANSDREILPNMLVPVSEGDYADVLFELTSDDGLLQLGVSDLNFTLAVNLGHDVTGVLPVANGGTNKSSWTDGRVVFVGAGGLALAEDSELNWNSSTKRLGIGTASPNAKVQINNSGTQVGLSVYSTSTNNALQFFNQGTTSYTAAFYNSADSAQTGASIGGYFSRGTLAARTQSLANDVLLSLTGSGYTGSAFAPSVSGGIVVAADQNTTAGGFGGQVSIVTTPNSTVSLPIPRLTVKNTGNVGIGTLNPGYLLDVNGTTQVKNLRVDDDNSSTNALSAAPYLVLNNQNSTVNTTAFVEFRGTVGLSNSAKARIGSVFTSIFNGELSFQVQSTGSMVEQMRLKSNGQLSIASLTATQLVATDASKNLQSLDTATYPSLTELSYVKGVTSAVQTQLNDKERKGYYTRITKSANYFATATDDYIGCDTNGGSFTVTLPAATGLDGKRIIVKDEGGNAGSATLIVAPNGGDEIDGVAGPQNIIVDYESITLVCNGSDGWFIV